MSEPDSAQLHAHAVELVATMRQERARRAAAGQDCAQVDRMLVELEAAAQQLHDVAVVAAIRGVVERHGGGPYPVEDLAAFTGLPDADVRRALGQLVDAGLAEPPEDSTSR
ncbi:hypothetical protein GCM10010123_45690 [Pilimelia anulata]|uniref:Uncharacterized protein n=1 Tax=Pilimelia anulata TaxID=53371 RepID=A0A8J3BBR3_9ACTN|nr:hypothetical protein [Pilimelia anulata]GGK10566.1 hypothetical protein GCM10010123_45690 [Pilimelia anulata]